MAYVGINAVQAHVRYNGTNNTITSDYNISSLTDVNTGRHWVNFTTNMSDANYSVVTGVTKQGNSDNSDQKVCVGGIGAREPATNRFPLSTCAGTASMQDVAIVCAAVFND